MSKRQKKRFLKLFKAIDKDGSGYISLIEWFVHMKLDHSPFIERSFRQMDINEEGDSKMQLDVCEVGTVSEKDCSPAIAAAAAPFELLLAVRPPPPPLHPTVLHRPLQLLFHASTHARPIHV